MKTLTEIQNDFSVKHGYKNITELIEESVKKGNTLQILLDLDKICIKVQQEQQKLIAENARLKVKLAIKNEPQIFNKYGNDDGFIEVSRESIINENNIIR